MLKLSWSEWDTHFKKIKINKIYRTLTYIRLKIAGMSAVGAVICNSYQDTGSYLFCGSHKALFTNKDETNKQKKKKGMFTKACFPILSGQFCLWNFIIICNWCIFGFTSTDLLNCWPLQETLKPLLLVLNFFDSLQFWRYCVEFSHIFI